MALDLHMQKGMAANRGKVSGSAVRSMEGFDRVAVKVWREVNDKFVADHTQEVRESRAAAAKGGGTMALSLEELR
jgi:hypothetical protein